MMSVSLQGLWELCSDKEWAMRLNKSCLQALIDTLQGDMLMPMVRHTHMHTHAHTQRHTTEICLTRHT